MPRLPRFEEIYFSDSRPTADQLSDLPMLVS